MTLARWAVLCIAAAALPAHASGGPPMAGAPGCRFVVPDGWPASGVRWSGACHGGLADGHGALRVYQGRRLARAFYGVVAAGQPALGVIDLGHGFVAGRFSDGKVVPGAERDELIEAFDEASSAARQVADGYRQAGRPASARFYEDKAKQLSMQMD
jgi:hypothetical protein